MSTYSTIQSRKFTLTKEEYDYFAKQDMNQCINSYIDRIRRDRKHTLSTTADERDTYSDYGRVLHPYVSPYTVGLRAFAHVISTFAVDKNAHIIDIAAGCGFLGIEMKKLGFENIDGLEPIECCIQNQPEGLYVKLYRELISKENPSSIPTEFYDCAIIGGGICTGHIEADALPEIIRIVKPGGFICFNLGDYWYKLNKFGTAVDAILQQFLENGTLESVTKQRSVYQYNYADGIVYILKKPE